jgi:2-polyprenyl-3-methyl-5-hydroxy-6-metoxy-1,4-benzoquinol methylase
VALEPHKQAEIDAHARFLREGHQNVRKPFGPGWGPDYWIKWATIAYAYDRLGLPARAEILDLGCGPGWTTLFHAEAGYQVVGVDIAPAAIEMATRRARRWGVDAEFVVADIEALNLERRFDMVLIFDALHHSTQADRVVEAIARHLRPGGWALFGEPSWLHTLSPAARREHRETGWIEKGVTVRGLKRHCRRVGMGGFRRFFEATQPYESRWRQFAWQGVRLAAANAAVAPRASIWLAAQKLG